MVFRQDTDLVSDHLADVRQRYEALVAATPGSQEGSPAKAQLIHVDVPELLEALEVVLKFHRRSMFPASNGENLGKHYCISCTVSINHDTCYEVWPCPEYRAVSAAFLTECDPE